MWPWALTKFTSSEQRLNEHGESAPWACLLNMTFWKTYATFDGVFPMPRNEAKKGRFSLTESIDMMMPPRWVSILLIASLTSRAYTTITAVGNDSLKLAT